ncbi:glycosyltransferase involved in cell wall biosynthesis [Paenibacillus taihuensis]|uniref:Glycosyltransferase involved in cell wall biosynthesis n=1 Tax=Paenibacillus taihuensis TaxID=1156355 RepID=A0A3D9Q954_9BACL|nr:glycosyltransferase [Paenibacillus taihuensis]REE57520.1 glycosyltransferase involved in cell wall biosynthesis [Paenibacillus taihuensis]
MNKILFIITGLDHAGAEMQVIELARGLVLNGWSVKIISLIKPTISVEKLNAEGILIDTLDMEKGVPDPRAIWQLRKLIKAYKPDIVHSHMIHANLLTRITRLFTRMPVLISTAHNTNEGGKVRMMMYRLTDSLCNLMTNVSQDAVDSFIQKGASTRNKLIFVPNGINLKRFKKNAEASESLRQELGLKDEFIWLAVGRLCEAKDYPTLLRSFNQVVKQNSHCQLLIVGDGVDRHMLEEMSSSLGLDDKIRFLGIREDIPRIMNASDAYVMSSLWEGMPMVLLEASACELPMVATDVGGNREVVKEGISGYLARASDSDHLAERMMKLMSLSTKDRDHMGEKAREYVMKHYEMDAIIAKWEALYHQLKGQRNINMSTIQGGL